MSTEKPRTAGQARVLFRQIIRELPEEERERFFFVSIGGAGNATKKTIACINELLSAVPIEEVLRWPGGIELEGHGMQFFLVPVFYLLPFILGLPEQQRRELLIEAVESMPPKERRRWIRYFEYSRPDMLGFVMVHNSLLDLFQDIFKKMLGRFVEDSEERRQVKNALNAFKNGPKALTDNKEERNQFIDGLIREQNTRGIAKGHEDWVKIRDAVLDKNKKWLKGKGKNGEERLMESADLKREYRRARPEYHEACKRPWKRRQTSE